MQKENVGKKGEKRIRTSNEEERKMIEGRDEKREMKH